MQIFEPNCHPTNACRRTQQSWAADAVIALEDENALTIEDPDHDQRRVKSLAMDPTLNVLFVAHCERSTNCIRIISARKAD